MKKETKSVAIGGHQSANMRTDEWLTPPEVLHSLGAFDLDPCSPIVRPWDTAKQHYTVNDNGLLLPWFGRVWLNPPYGDELERWMAKMAQHRAGIALIFARTDTQAFHKYIFPVADSILFIERRLKFWTAAGSKARYDGGAPSVLIAYGEDNVDCLEHCGIRGHHAFINSVPMIVVGINSTWKSVVSVALMRRNGEAHLSEIYKIVSQIAPTKITKNKHWMAKIRQECQTHFERYGKGKYKIPEPAALKENTLF